METMVRWEIEGDHQKELQDVLRAEGLKKSIFNHHFKGKGVLVEYDLDDRILPFLSRSASKPITHIELCSQDSNMAQRVYEQLNRWAESLSTKVERYGDLNYAERP